MAGEDTVAATRERLAQVGAELDARRELRERGARNARAQANEGMLRIGPVAERAAAHLAELGRRQRDAGGWATRKTRDNKESALESEPDDDQPGDPYAGASMPANAEPDTIGVLAEADEPVRAEPRRPVPPEPGARRRAVTRGADEDDFSATSSWLTE